jgi:hypothetical protein
MKNYRPISLLSAILNIFEKLLFEQILNFLHDNNLLSPHFLSNLVFVQDLPP